ncbi:MAG: hypothetical protein ACK5L6_02615 [Anaerorhabdus sp.]|uniref:hypothetical protein n=1 Tax=Anaerorhabdus sp. TaxID=1872524 RepID=UPI003A8700F7
MKVTIQIYSFLLIFCVLLFIIPQVISIAMIYRICNSTASYVVEIIEVNEGMDNQGEVMRKIENYIENHSKIELKIEKGDIDKTYNTYEVTCFNRFHIAILNLDYEVKASKNTRRVIY